jgi:hypothetical protein
MIRGSIFSLLLTIFLNLIHSANISKKFQCTELNRGTLKHEFLRVAQTLTKILAFLYLLQ